MWFCEPGRTLDRENTWFCEPGRTLDRENTWFCGPGRTLKREKLRFSDPSVKAIRNFSSPYRHAARTNFYLDD